MKKSKNIYVKENKNGFYVTMDGVKIAECLTTITQAEKIAIDKGLTNKKIKMIVNSNFWSYSMKL